MKALFIGGTGTISTSISRLAVASGWELTLLNRGRRSHLVPAGARVIQADIADESNVAALLGDERFDVVAQFIAYRADEIERDIRLFANRCDQYLFISTASAYQKPSADWLITESTPLANPWWQYSRDKIACEEVLTRAYREQGFPITIVRPSHTYAEWSLPLCIHGGSPWPTLARMRAGKPVLVIGDGTSLWTVTHADDFARAFFGLMGNVHAIGHAVHITSDEAMPWNQIYTTIGHALGVTPKLHHVTSDEIIRRKPEFAGNLLGDKAHSAVFDNSKIKRLVPGWTAQIRFDQGCRRTIAWFEANPEARKDDPQWDAFVDELTR